MTQTMRFRRGDPIVFEIQQEVTLLNEPGFTFQTLKQQDTSTVPDPTKQTYITFEFVPYIRDGDYDNQMLVPLSK